MEKAVLLTLEPEDYELYEDGIFLTKKGWNKVETNILRIRKESELLRTELDKFK